MGQEGLGILFGEEAKQTSAKADWASEQAEEQAPICWELAKMKPIMIAH